MHEARYEARQHGLPNPYQFAVALEGQNYKAPDRRPAHYCAGRRSGNSSFFSRPSAR
jgi:hypothetical protein